jgi:alcohol dehydrogenase
MAFATAVVARGGKIVVGSDGRKLQPADGAVDLQAHDHRRIHDRHAAEGRELMELAKAGKVKPTPMKEEPMGDVQKWIDQLRAGKVVGRIMLTN